ncbi:MAG: hypothetical protein ABSE82_16465 [Nitrososphaerales archaeon]|jgi:hypothetical protein
MPTTNVFEAILGRKAVKWDAFWHLFEWLVDPNEGHGLGDSFRRQLLLFAFGEPFDGCVMRREYPVSGQTDGKGKWADFALGIPTFHDPTRLILMDDIGEAGSGGQRKLKNLLEYSSLSRMAHPTSRIRVVAVINAPAGKKLVPAVYTALGEETAEFALATGWKLLPLQTIGTWVREAMEPRHEQLSAKAKSVLEEFAEWCE